MPIQAVIATNRFGLGAKPNEISNAQKSPKNWLLEQLSNEPVLSFDKDLPTSTKIMDQIAHYKKLKQRKKNNHNEMSEQDKERISQLQKYPRQIHQLLSADTLIQAITSNNSLNWRLLNFFSNHFSVTAQGQLMTAIAPTLEREAIAPNLLGNFEDMLLAVIKHPAMLMYLNNERSFGPQSKLGKRGKGLNENLAREILELHTLGVNGGYSQIDVTELAKGITGWGISKPLKEQFKGFKYRDAGHEPGTRKLLGHNFKDDGIKQGEKMLKLIAQHPSTAKYVCFKLARHFINDEPPEALVNRMVARWNSTNGKIKDVVIEVINAKESWSEISHKYIVHRLL